MAIDRHTLTELYIGQKKSSQQIARLFKCSENKVNYWLQKYAIEKRSISEAVYNRHNPEGDPFKLKNFKIDNNSFLFGLGLGLYWGEGTKSNLSSIRLGNTDPALIKMFINFLEQIYGIKKDKLHFGLQIFSDLSSSTCLNYWQQELGIEKNKFYKPILSPSQSTGTYKRKASYGVLTLYFNNKKLRDIIVSEIEKLRKV